MTTSAPGTAGRGESTMDIQFTIICPCCGEEVTGTDAGFSATTVTVASCSKRQAAGIVSSTWRKTAAYAAAKPYVETTVRHRDGLVSFSGAI